MKSEKTLKSGRLDTKPTKCAPEFAFKKNEARAKLDGSKQSQSLLNVPSNSAAKRGSESARLNRKTASEKDLSTLDLVDSDTISMIVRNVEAFEKKEAQKHDDMVDVALPGSRNLGARPKTFGSSKKNVFMHDIQEKLHHITDNIKKHDLLHKTESPPRDHCKTKEILNDLKDNVSGKFQQIAEKIHHFHLPHMTHSHEVPRDGLVGQAMQTILMEKFNIVEATQKRRPSSSSLQSIKHKLNLFQRPRRSVELQSESGSLNSILEVQSPEHSSELPDQTELPADDSSILELEIHKEPESASSKESLVTILPKCDRKAVSRDDLRISVDKFDPPFTSTHQSFSKIAAFTDTNKAPLHASLLSLSRNEMLSTSPAVKTHTRNESVGFAASPSKHVSSSLGKDMMTTGIHRRSSDSDLSITPKGKF